MVEGDSKFILASKGLGSMLYIFYVMQSQDIPYTDESLCQDYSIHSWEPGAARMLVRLLVHDLPMKAKIQFLFFSALHYLRLFRSSGYSIFTVHCGKKVVHYSVVLPKYFLLPFMEEGDVHIGPCWTRDAYRGRGIASYGVWKILESCKGRTDRFWYVSAEGNIGSNRVAERLGFIQYGKGFRAKRLGIEAISPFVIAGNSGKVN